MGLGTQSKWHLWQAAPARFAPPGVQGRPVGAAQANLVVAACCQRGDLQQAFATFDSFGALGLEPNADTYNALMQVGQHCRHCVRVCAAEHLAGGS